jgi:hypothetical protein
MCGERIATFRFGDLGGERFDRVDTADKHVAQRFATSLRSSERGHRRSDGMIRGGGHGVHDATTVLLCLFSPESGGSDSPEPRQQLAQQPVGGSSSSWSSVQTA